MSGTRHTKTVALDAAIINRLEQTLRAQLQIHHSLLTCISRKKEAIRTADMNLISAVCDEEGGLIQSLAKHEEQRVECARLISQAIGFSNDRDLRMADVAELIAEPQQSRLIGLAAQLRDAAQELRQQSSIVRAASDALSRHMNGIVQTVYSALSRARVYGQGGRIAMGAQVQSMVDIKS